MSLTVQSILIYVLNEYLRELDHTDNLAVFKYKYLQCSEECELCSCKASKFEYKAADTMRP